MKTWIGALLLALAAPLRAEAPTPLFATDDPIHIVLKAPVNSHAHNRASKAAIPGTVTDPAGATLPVTLELRGIARRTSEACDFPPLRVTFTAPPPPTSLFAHQHRLKLVTHCRSSDAFQQYVLLEYAAYRMFNVLSPRSFRARLANIDYVAPDGRPITSRVGFFIEDQKDMARRNGMKEVHAPELISGAYLNPTDSARYALFQHMIANHDWSMRAGPKGDDCCHNAKLIGTLAAGMTSPIPYDFDFSGLVAPPYATPPDELHISSVRDRVYRGYCAHNAQVLAVAREFRAAKPQLLAALNSTPGLTDRSKQRALAFLEPFFADIASDDLVQAKLLRRCLN